MYGDELYHYRTKGSKNGISTDPNYTPIGQRAQSGSALEQYTRAQRQANAESAEQRRAAVSRYIDRMRNSAQATANTVSRGVNTTAAMYQQAQADAEARKRLAEANKRRKKEEREARIKAGKERLASSIASTANAFLNKRGVTFKRGNQSTAIRNPYEEGYTGVSRVRAGAADRAKFRKDRMKQAHEDAKAGKYGRLAQAKAYGKEGFDAATRIAKQARNLPGQARSEYYKKRYELTSKLAEAKKEAQQSEAYKRTKAGVKKAADAASKVAKRASDAVAKADVKERASNAAKSVGEEAERLKRKGLSVLKKLRK